MTLLEDIKRVLNGRSGAGGSVSARCPAHEDRQASFRASINKKNPDKIDLECYAGCDIRDINRALQALGVDPLPKREKKPKRETFKKWFSDPRVGDFCCTVDEPSSTLDTIYTFYNENSQLVGFKARLQPKTFRQFTRMPDGTNKWGKCGAIPYRLPQILAAIKENKAVHCFEGEKDADTAAALNIVATSFGSASEPLPVEYWGHFRNSKWVIWGDTDDKGIKRANEIALALHNQGCSLKVVYAPQGKDLTDWVKKFGATIEDIKGLLSCTENWMPPAEAVEAAQEKGILPRTAFDIGTEAYAGEYVAKVFEEKLKYVPEFKSWLWFDGHVWNPDRAERYRECIKELALQIKRDVNAGQLDPIVTAPLLKLSHKLQGDSGVRAVANMSRSVPRILVSASELDNSATGHLLSCGNGVLDLRESKILPHSPKYLVTKHCKHLVDFDGQPEMFKNFVQAMFQDNSVAEWMFNYLGYCLTGENGLQKFCVWVGKPGTGKSQLQNVMRGLLDNQCGSVDADSLVLTRQRSPGTDSDLASISGCRMVFASELSAYHKLDERILKALTGEDPFKAKLMGQNKAEIRANAKLVFTANERPLFSDDGGIARRLIEIQFKHEPERIIEKYADKMLAHEGPRILGFLAQRAALYYANPKILDLPPAIASWTKDYVDEIDTVRQWADARTMFMTGIFTPTKDLSEDYVKWSKSNGLQPNYSERSLGRKLSRLGGVADRECGRRGWRNILLKNE
jgi:putative DNA primase/helicase